MMARANAALPDTDPRKIRPEDVAKLQRLSEQASDMNFSMVAHAEERRRVGERRDRVSLEAGDTAQWAARLAAALEAMLDSVRHVPRRTNAAAPRRAPKATARSENDEYLAHQKREFRADDGSLWRVRIEQGGGKQAAASGGPPVAALIFQSANDPDGAELSAAEPGGSWDLTGYTVAELRAVLARARAARR